VEEGKEEIDAGSMFISSYVTTFYLSGLGAAAKTDVSDSQPSFVGCESGGTPDMNPSQALEEADAVVQMVPRGLAKS